MAFARGALHLTSVAHIHCRLERSRPWTISPQPHPNFIEVSGDAAPGDRYWAVEGAGEDGADRLNRVRGGRDPARADNWPVGGGERSA